MSPGVSDTLPDQVGNNKMAEKEPQGTGNLELGIVEDLHRLQTARRTGQLVLELEFETSMNERLDDWVEQHPNIVRGTE